MGKTVKRCVKSCRKYRSKIHRKTRSKVHRKTRGKKNIYKINRTRHQRGGGQTRLALSETIYYLSLDNFIETIDAMQWGDIFENLNNWDTISREIFEKKIRKGIYMNLEHVNLKQKRVNFLSKFLSRAEDRAPDGTKCSRDIQSDDCESNLKRIKPAECKTPYYAYCNEIHHEIMHGRYNPDLVWESKWDPAFDRRYYHDKLFWPRPRVELIEICRMLLRFKLYTLEKILIPSEHDVHARFFVELDMELLTTSSPPTYTRLVINIYKMSQYYNNQRPEIQNKLSNTFYRRFYWLLEIMKNINNTNYINIYQTIPWIEFKAVSEAKAKQDEAKQAKAKQDEAKQAKAKQAEAQKKQASSHDSSLLEDTSIKQDANDVFNDVPPDNLFDKLGIFLTKYENQKEIAKKTIAVKILENNTFVEKFVEGVREAKKDVAAEIHEKDNISEKDEEDNISEKDEMNNWFYNMYSHLFNALKWAEEAKSHHQQSKQAEAEVAVLKAVTDVDIVLYIASIFENIEEIKSAVKVVTEIKGKAEDDHAANKDTNDFWESFYGVFEGAFSAGKEIIGEGKKAFAEIKEKLQSK